MDEGENVVLEVFEKKEIGSENFENLETATDDTDTREISITDKGSTVSGTSTERSLEEPELPGQDALLVQEGTEMALEKRNSESANEMTRKVEEFGGFNGLGKEGGNEGQDSVKNGADNVRIEQDSAQAAENKGEEATRESTEMTAVRSTRTFVKSHPGPKHYVPPGWVYHGESDGYRYYIGCAGEMYSVDRDGYWYVQDGGGNFIPYNGYQYGRIPHSTLFPRDSQGRFILPTNARGEKNFPVDINNMPMFPFDTATHLPTFPVDENGQPVFPTAPSGRPIVPVDTNGMAIFPRDANGRFIFPSGPNGKPTAPVNIYGVPVMPLDEQGKPVVPYDATGAPLIHLASDGITPLTEEEYQYSMQWNDYYSSYYKNTTVQKSNSSRLPAAAENTYEQKARNMKLLKKVRPEDIDLPPTVPPPPTTQPSIPPPPDISPLSSTEIEKPKTAPDPALKAKTKKMIEMQLKFSRKKFQDGNQRLTSVTLPGEAVSSSPVEFLPSTLPETVESQKLPPLPPSIPTASANPPAPARTDSENEIECFPDAISHETQEPESSQIPDRSDSISSESSATLIEAAVCQMESTPNITDRPTNSSVKELKSPKSSVHLSGSSASTFPGESPNFEKESGKTVNEHIASEGNMKIHEKQAEPVVINITNEVNVDTVMKSEVEGTGNSREDDSLQKMGKGKKLSADDICESTPAVQYGKSRKHLDKDVHTPASREKRSDKSRHGIDLRSEDRKKSGSRRRRSRSRSSYRDSHRRSRSREMRRRSRSESRTPHRDYYHRSRYRSRSRNRHYRHDYYGRRNYRRYRTPDAEERYSYRKRRSSSRNKSARRERSLSRDRTPTVDKSSRSPSNHEQSKSRSPSPNDSQRSSIARSISQQKTTDTQLQSSSCRSFPDHDISQKTERESDKSAEPLSEDLITTEDVTDMRKSVSRSASPRSEKSSLKDGHEIKGEKSKKRRRAKDKHKRKKRSHHKKKDKRKRSLSEGESDTEYSRRASSTLADQAEQDLNIILNEQACRGEVEIPNSKEDAKNCKKERMKRKNKKKKKERNSSSEEGTEVEKKTSELTLEEGEIITGKDISPRATGKALLSCATFEFDEEEDDMGTSTDIVEEPIAKTTRNTYTSADVNKEVEEQNLKSAVSLQDISAQIESMKKKTTYNDISETNLETVLKEVPEQASAKRDTKITMELEDEGKSVESASDALEITPREAEKLKIDNITEAMNKLKKLRGYKKTVEAISSSATDTSMVEQLSKKTDSDSAVVVYNIADVPLPKEVQVIADVTEKAEQTEASEVRVIEASTSAKKIDKEIRRKKEILKRKWEEDEEDELSRLRYEALRSKTRRLMNDLRAERRRLKRERIRANIAIRRARERSADMTVDEILFVDTSDSTDTDDSDDYSPTRKRKLLKRKRYVEGEVISFYSNKNKSLGEFKADENLISSGGGGGGATGDLMESCNAQNDLILELQQRIGESNEGALALLEQLKKCLAGGVVSSNIHVNPEVIRKTV